MTQSHLIEPDPKQKRRFWQEHLKQWRQSRLSQLAYCRQHELTPHKFTYWKKIFVQDSTDISFVPLSLAHNLPVPACRKAFNLFTHNNYKIQVEPGFDPVTLKQLISAVDSL